jgi:hypothetical protein
MFSLTENILLEVKFINYLFHNKERNEKNQRVRQVCDCRQLRVWLRLSDGKREAGQCLRTVHLSEPHEEAQRFKAYKIRLLSPCTQSYAVAKTHEYSGITRDRDGAYHLRRDHAARVERE